MAYEIPLLTNNDMIKTWVAGCECPSLWRGQRELLAIQLFYGAAAHPVNWGVQHPEVRASWRLAAQRLMLEHVD